MRPATVALDAVLVRRADLAVWVDDVRVYPTGVWFAVCVNRRAAADGRRVPFFEEDERVLRLGLALADGTKAIAEGLARSRWLHERPDGPRLRPVGGGGSGSSSRADLWLWPLPPAGALTFVCDWPAEDVAETRVTVDGAAIVAAAARAEELWPDERPLPGADDEVVV